VDSESVSALFRNLDDLHFASRLQQAQWQIWFGLLHRPEEKAEARLRVLHDKVWGCTLPAKRLIILDSRLLGSEPALRIVLLHEMVHAKTANKASWYSFADLHGEQFLMELKRLRREGEEHLQREIRYYSRLLRRSVFRDRRVVAADSSATRPERIELSPDGCLSAREISDKGLRFFADRLRKSGSFGAV
jgi:hypothetical protein